jgi:hypothetical protein
MSSKSAEYKRRLKENDPEKYAVLLAKAKERNRHNREKRKDGNLKHKQELFSRKRRPSKKSKG